MLKSKERIPLTTMNGIPEEFIDIVAQNSRVQAFLQNSERVEVLVKEITFQELERLKKEYPKFFNWNLEEIKPNDKGIILYSITLLKRDRSPNNYTKTKKIKLYIEKSTKKILKILSN